MWAAIGIAFRVWVERERRRAGEASAPDFNFEKATIESGAFHMYDPARRPLKNPPRADDGRGSLTRGVAVSWVAQMLQIIAGFIIPRLIDRQLGRELLGVWGLGMVDGQLFHLAGWRHWINDKPACRAASRGGRFRQPQSRRQFGGHASARTGRVDIAIDFAPGLEDPVALPTRSPELATQASGLVLLLGASMAVAIAGAIYGGILTGCHRWPLQHTAFPSPPTWYRSLECAWPFGCGRLGRLGGGSLCQRTLGADFARHRAHRACPGLDIRARNADLATLRKLFWFGGKMFAGRMSQIVMHQTVNIMIASHLGLAALALFSRPKSLVRQAAVFSAKIRPYVGPGRRHPARPARIRAKSRSS